MKKIAILITSHNRKDNTLACLNSLYKAELPKNIEFNIFLVDDGSTDGTGEAVKKCFSSVNIIQGDGTLFWNQGMRLAWQKAAATKEFDFFIWLNDDTILEKVAINELINNYTEAFAKDNKPSIIVGSCRNDTSEHIFSYGGRNDSGPVIPNGKIQTCKYINGNVVLVPNKIYQNIGNLSNDYTHAIGDNDYGLRAIQNGYICYTTKTYVATCSKNSIPDWCNPSIFLIKRIKLFYSPKGLNIKEYNKFRRKFWGRKWIMFFIKAYLKVLFPYLYSKF